MRKSNLIVAAMAFAALVGCQKELAPVVGAEQAGDAGLDQRPVLASSTLTFGGVETRVAAGGTGSYNWQWEAGDQVGAVLVDVVNEETTLDGYVKAGSSAENHEWTYAEYVNGTVNYPTAKADFYFKSTYTTNMFKTLNNAEGFYDVTDDMIWTNYPYKTEDAKTFYTPATLVEGNYVFYAPYNAGNGTRGPLVATLPVEQYASEASNQAVDEFYKGNAPVVLAMNYLSADETSTVNPTFGHIYAYPEFTIVNNYEGYLFDGKNKAKGSGTFLSTENEAKEYTMTVKQVEIYAGTNSDNLFAYKREIKPTVLKKTEDWVSGDEYKTTETNKVAVPVAGDFAFAKADQKVYYNDGLAADVTKESQRIVVTLNKELKPGAKYTFNAVVPGADYSDAGLYARVLVTIDDVDYYIVTNEVTANKYDKTATVVGMASKTGNYPGYATIPATGLTTYTDYRFIDRHNRGSEDLTLVRGQRYPAAEVNANKTAKNFKGELLTIELVGGQAQVAIAAATEETKQTTGITNNEELIDFLNGVHRAADVEQVESAEEVDNTHFYLDDENTVIINAELLEAMSNMIPDGSFTLIENLPIANDVVVSTLGYETFTFTAGEVEYDITYNDVTFNSDAANLVAGINVINANAADVKVKSGQANAVVFLQAGGTVKTPAGINGIVVAAGALTVNASADVTAWVVADNVTIIRGGLVNKLNEFETVENNALATINGEVETVKYTSLGFGTTAIPAASKVNYVTISAAQAVHLTVDAAAIAYFKNLEDVTIEFDEKILSLVSSANVTLTNIAAVNGNSIKWNTPENQVSGVKVFYNGTENEKDTFFTGVEEGDAVTFSPLK